MEATNSVALQPPSKKRFASYSTGYAFRYSQATHRPAYLDSRRAR